MSAYHAVKMQQNDQTSHISISCNFHHSVVLNSPGQLQYTGTRFTQLSYKQGSTRDEKAAVTPKVLKVDK